MASSNSGHKRAQNNSWGRNQSKSIRHAYRKTSNKCPGHLLEHGPRTPAFNRDRAIIRDPEFNRSFTVSSDMHEKMIRLKKAELDNETLQALFDCMQRTHKHNTAQQNG